ncbi:MAG: hypothetical protein ACREMY_19025, partial [bacterium]
MATLVYEVRGQARVATASGCRFRSIQSDATSARIMAVSTASSGDRTGNQENQGAHGQKRSQSHVDDIFNQCEG